MGFEDLVGPGWAEALAPVGADIAAMGDWLRSEGAAGRSFLPDGDKVFAALRMPLGDVRVLIVGQDPYPTPGHPIGLCFAAAPHVQPVPKSLNNIFTEYCDDLGLARPANGDLTPWVDEGVCLLNRVLTVRPGSPASHRGKGWEAITEAIIDVLVRRDQPLVAILWGRDARNLASRLGAAPRVESTHPSPLSAHRGFFGSRPFSRTNHALAELGADPIDWTLPT